MEILIDMMTEILQWYDMFKKTQDRVEEIRKCDSEIIDELTILSTQKLKAKDKEEILIANTAREYADYIIELLDNKELAQNIANKGKDYVFNQYSWQINCEKLSDIFMN